ncbi:MAG: hypothetical protein NPIRA05_06910 [Nitrospirales bacterium]|nr:MAG: hypothetical protein NPIRA05_06910 [Nitrospirales bacterium]
MDAPTNSLLAEAKHLLDDEKYEEALVCYLSLAEQGEPHAQTMVGWIYQYGLGVQQCDKEAKKWYVLAAQSEYCSAEFYLGVLCMQNEDYESGKNWYEKSAAHGYMPAVYRLAWIYQEGKGVNVDKDRAYELFNKNAQDGHIFSQMAKAKILLKGCRGPLGRLAGVYYYLKSKIQLPIVAFRNLDSDRVRP